ncbi:SDR family oxidoreductase [Beggiatoa leptomitoformis]|uniref:SDR family oxidoreductase n=1 Tax=Beggiatoa leptomitoformis TaxID=288004 RepID=A0A2N9YFC3_9GAMM|nr:SDR family oxidoreductase [Beggiatoa leptomitoformis]ALG68490.1 SDR family oxidoreductase [Beggiatoa leptomitoformis]AUI69174.1 SDR family oxidoreductase [Beggiatoa leptomitoformis]
MNPSNQRTVLVTGCSSGIGYCVAKGLLARGYRVFATARRAEDIARLQAEGLETLLLDLNDSVSIQHAVTQLLSQTGGKLYGLFNNAAYGQPGAVEDLSRQALREQFETNLFGTHELTTLVLPVMRRQGEGRIIHNSSILGMVAMPMRGAYNASKFALEGLTDTLRIELQGTNIGVSLIEPGPIRSRFRANAFAMYKKHINPTNSPHQAHYQQAEARLQKQGDAAPFTLPPEAVLKRVIHALEAKQPQIRYYVTIPTYFLTTLKRLLPYRVMDWIIRRLPA